ncbi:hypothetical protein ZIOFF_021833 [Zingiber officinale]|uniref:dUTPase-like domain-containing protein n=1 Tax=Zingiber officinale TaxID=94328 RepID=A0A8J5LJS5_ZINOF|nr:hypothetical protein ZIOFF_021833 [Zingiber officinale]
MQYIHLGVLQVRIQILHRQREGTMALIVFRDNRWQGDQAILATMEVDLTHGSQMIYVIPETIMTIGDFYQNVQISILARGFEAWQNSEANLLITRGKYPYATAEVNSQTMVDGRISLSFSNYTAAQPSENPQYNNKDEEAVIPERQTSGSAGLDIAASHAAVIEPYGRDLIHTGLQIEVPYGYYG